ncbi:TonB-dependent receptor [Desulfovibrio sp.]
MRQKPTHGKLLTVLAALAWLALPRGVALADSAQDKTEATQLDAVVVTAQKVKQDIIKAPVSVTAVGAEEIEALGLDNLDELPALVPNLNFQKFGAHFTEFNYRGIGGVTTMSKTWNVNFDGATLPYVGLDSLYDVDRIEVLRGGQGALYGRNTNAGTINVFTPEPSFTPGGKFDVSYGTYGQSSAKGAVDAPLNDVLSMRLSAWRSSEDGFIKNDTLDKDDAGSSWQNGLHVKLLARPDEETDMTLAVLLDEYSADSPWMNMANGRSLHSQSNDEGSDEGGLATGMFTLNRDLDFGRFTSITAFSQSRYDLRTDMDATATDFMILGYREDFNTLTHEMRMSSPEDNGPWRWLGGLFLLHEESDYHTDISGLFSTPGASSSKAALDTNSIAGFGQLGWRFLPDWELTGGLRMGYERRKFDWTNQDTGQDFEESRGWTSILPSASLSWEFTPRQTAYASASRGYRSGDFTANETNTATLLANPVVEPEYTWTYELGYKAEFLDRTLRLNTAVFYIEWDDMQVTAITSGGIQVRQNAAKSHSTGAEAEVQWLPIAGLTVFGQGGFIDAVFDEYEPMTGGDPSGNCIPNTPEYSFGGGMLYEHPSGVFAGFDITRYGKKYLNELNTLTQEPYTLVNAKIGYRYENWHVALVGKNLGDERYVVRSYQFMPGIAPAVMAAPLTCAVELGAEF